MVVLQSAGQNGPPLMFKVTYFDAEWNEDEALSFRDAGYLSAFSAVREFIDYRIKLAAGLSCQHHPLNGVTAITLELDNG